MNMHSERRLETNADEGRVLRQEDSAANEGNHKPVSRQLDCRRRNVRTISPARSSSTVRECPIDKNRAGAIDIRNRNNALIQRVVTPVPNQLIQLRVITILVTATLAVFLAQTVDGLGLVRVHGGVVEAIGVCVGVAVDAVEPERGEDGECACGEEEDGGDPGCGACACWVGDGGTSAVVASPVRGSDA